MCFRKYRQRLNNTNIYAFAGLLLVCLVISVSAIMLILMYHSAYANEVENSRREDRQATLDRIRDDADSVFRMTDRVVVSLSLELELYRYLNPYISSPLDDSFHVRHITGVLNNINSSHRSIHSVYLYAAERDTVLTSGDGVWNIHDFYDLAWKDESDIGHYHISFTQPRSIANRFGRSESVLSAVWSFYTFFDVPSFIVVNYHEQRFIDLLSTGKGDQLLVTDSENKQILSTADSGFSALVNQYFDEFAVGRNYPRLYDIDGSDVEIYTTVSNFNNWIYVLRVPFEQTFLPIREGTQSIYLISIVALFCLLASLFLLSMSRKQRAITQREYIQYLTDGGFSEYIDFGKRVNTDIEAAVMVIIYSLDNHRRFHGTSTGAALNRSLEQLMRINFDEKHQKYITAFDPKLMRRLVILHASAQQSQEDLKQLIRSNFDCIAKELGATVSVGVSDIHYSRSEIPASIQEACEALKYRFVFGHGCLLYYEMFNASALVYFSLPAVRMDTFSSHLSNGNVSEARTIIEKTATEVTNLGIVFHANAQRVFISLFDSIASVFKLKNLDCQKLCNQNYEILFFRISESETISEAVSVLGEMLDSYEKYLVDKSSESREDVIERMKEYIDLNHDKEISLSMFAESVYFSESYLSRLFKQRTGENFLQYLTRKRIATAKMLLKNPEYRIADIAQAVSFGNAKAFITAFKKYEGVTPGKYRKTLMERPQNDMKTDSE